MKEKFCRFLAKLVLRIMGHPQGMTLFQEVFFPEKFLAITVLDSAEELDLFREEQEWLDEVAQKARRGAGDQGLIEGPEEDDLDRDIEAIMSDKSGKKTLLQ